MDTVNTVEQIVVNGPATGTWKVHPAHLPALCIAIQELLHPDMMLMQVMVKSKAMPYATAQAYALVINSGGKVQE